MSAMEQPLVGQEIVVPTSLPMILKQFCKAAIRTQPYDLLKWSSSYFRALADGEEPPTKLRLEYPPPSTASGLTLGFLRVLLRQFGDYNKLLSVETILRRWDCLCLDRKDLNLIMMIGKFRRKCQVKKFLAIAVGLLGSSLFDTMIMICELFTHEPEGGSAMVPVTLFMEIYGYLAGLRCDGSERDSFGEDPTEFILCDELNDSVPLDRHVPNEEKLFSDRVYSITSQDTDADVNLDLELVSKEDGDSSRTDITPHLTDSPIDQKEIVDDKLQENIPSGRTLKAESKRRLSCDEENSNKTGKLFGKFDIIGNSPDDDSYKSQDVRSIDDAASDRGRRKKKVADSKLIRYYPNVPGIGPRLSAEEVASVAIWMSECARLQEGMVGPRNLRHMNCPPLDRQVLQS